MHVKITTARTLTAVTYSLPFRHSFLQLFFSLTGPNIPHPFPALLGSGSLHFLTRVMIPSPQLTEQYDHGSQAAHFFS